MRRFHCVTQAALKLLSSSDPPTSASQSAKITNVSHCTELAFFLNQPLPSLKLVALKSSTLCLFLRKQNFNIRPQSPNYCTQRVEENSLSSPPENSKECQKMESRCVTKLESSGPILAHCNNSMGSKLICALLKMKISVGLASFLINIPQKFRSVAQADVQWCDLTAISAFQVQVILAPQTPE
ncbi:hypothetical protein AAY473_010151 [Plecturocebus cupreus]